MKKREEIVEVVYQALRELNEQLTPESQIVLSPETVLVGSNGGLDSLGIINLIAGVEQAVQDKFGVTITLFAEDPASTDMDAWATVGSLADHLESVVNSKMSHS
jgi:acyl carrier protein